MKIRTETLKLCKNWCENIYMSRAPKPGGLRGKSCKWERGTDSRTLGAIVHAVANCMTGVGGALALKFWRVSGLYHIRTRLPHASVWLLEASIWPEEAPMSSSVCLKEELEKNKITPAWSIRRLHRLRASPLSSFSRRLKATLKFLFS